VAAQRDPQGREYWSITPPERRTSPQRSRGGGRKRVAQRTSRPLLGDEVAGHGEPVHGAEEEVLAHRHALDLVRDGLSTADHLAVEHRGFEVVDGVADRDVVLQVVVLARERDGERCVGGDANAIEARDERTSSSERLVSEKAPSRLRSRRPRSPPSGGRGGTTRSSGSSPARVAHPGEDAKSVPCPVQHRWIPHRRARRVPLAPS
jgi:hypothetical protein